MAGQAWVETMQRRLLAEEGKAEWLTESALGSLCDAVTAVLASQPSLVELPAPVAIVGNLHGQFQDLRRLLRVLGEPGHCSPYLFLGDYVDRGQQSTETIALLFCCKILYPDHVWLLRGNHECALVTKTYGFQTEMVQRYSLRLWKRFTDAFDWLPVAGLVAGRILCVHGGLSPELASWDAVRALQRPKAMPASGLMCDLIWSDPSTVLQEDWAPNKSRGVGLVFSASVVQTFCRSRGVDLIVRGHQVQEKGCQFFAGRRLLTLFSAPNFCGSFENDGAADLECQFYVLRPAFPPGYKARP